MASVEKTAQVEAIEHAGEDQSNQIRQLSAELEPKCLRTYTSSLAVLSRSEGSYHYTPEGRKLADFTSGVLVANLGHNPTRWWQRVHGYMGLDRLAGAGEFCDAVPLTAYNALTELEVQATQRLLANMHSQAGSDRLEQVLWSASGSEAVQKALWTAMLRKPGADIILATRGGFHGKKGLADAVTGSEKDKNRDPRVRFISFPIEECGSIERRREPIDLAPYEAELAAIAEEYGDRLCCLITEPYLGGGGSFHPQKEYMHLLQRFCREHDILLILDEVQANFGRTGSMYAFTEYGLEPDMVVLGKGMANGMPVDAVVGPAELFAKLNYGEGSDTWSAHPLGCAAVLATLDLFEEEDILGHAAQLAEVIEAGLVRLTELPAIHAIRGEGTVWGVECAAFGSRDAVQIANDIVAACYRGNGQGGNGQGGNGQGGNAQGQAIHLLGPLAGKVLRVAPPLVMPLDEAKAYLDVMYEIIAGLEG